jgi:hypothetical protein
MVPEPVPASLLNLTSVKLEEEFEMILNGRE